MKASLDIGINQEDAEAKVCKQPARLAATVVLPTPPLGRQEDNVRLLEYECYVYLQNEAETSR